MSDCFDHAGDAFDDMSPGGRSYEEGYAFNYNPLYYHAKVEFDSIKARTEKAQLFVITHSDEITLEMWIPTTLIREQKKNSMFIFRQFFVKAYGTALKEQVNAHKENSKPESS